MLPYFFKGGESADSTVGETNDNLHIQMHVFGVIQRADGAILTVEQLIGGYTGR